MARAAGRETERAQALVNERPPPPVPSPEWEVDVSCLRFRQWTDGYMHTIGWGLVSSTRNVRNALPLNAAVGTIWGANVRDVKIGCLFISARKYFHVLCLIRRTRARVGST